MRGRPKLAVRIDPDFLEQVQEAFPTVTGRSGGVGLAVRQLLHLALDKPVPVQYGEVRRSEDIDEMETRVRRMERGEEPLEGLGEAMKLARGMMEGASPVDTLRLRAVLGRLWMLAPMDGS